MNIFEQATKMKLRFPTVRGDVTVEDLWDMPLQERGNFDLDTTALGTKRELAMVSEESFIPSKPNPKVKALELRLEILKHIIGFKLEEQAIKKKHAEKIVEREKLVHILARKQDAALEQMSEEEIRQRLAKLED